VDVGTEKRSIATERVAVAGIFIGAAGVVASVALPPAYADILSVTTWRLIFWESIFAACGGLAFVGFEALRRFFAAKVTTYLSAYIMLYFLFMGFTMHFYVGHALSTRYAIGGVVGAALGLLLVGVYNWAETPAQQPTIQTTSQNSTDSTTRISVFAECKLGPLPTTYDRISILYVFPLPIENGGGGLSELFWSNPDGNAHMKWPKDTNGSVLIGYRCQLTNYYAMPIFKVSFSLRLRFMKIVSDGNANTMHSGDEILVRPWRITVPKIDVGVNSGFVFYVANTNSSSFAEVSFMPEADCDVLNNDARQKVNLILPPAGIWMTFAPFIAEKSK